MRGGGRESQAFRAEWSAAGRGHATLEGRLSDAARALCVACFGFCLNIGRSAANPPVYQERAIRLVAARPGPVLHSEAASVDVTSLRKKDAFRRVGGGDRRKLEPRARTDNSLRKRVVLSDVGMFPSVRSRSRKYEERSLLDL
jgi:hypothetical protein